MANPAAAADPLENYVAARLADLGLDAETYAPYVLPAVRNEGTEEETREEWETVLQLLQASSETHADEDECWQQFRRDVQEEYRKLTAQEEEERRRREAEEQVRREQEQEQLRMDLQESRQAVENHETSAGKPQLDAAKQALLARFAYEDSDDDIKEEELPLDVPASGAVKASPGTNTSSNAKASAAPPTTSKQVERQKTKQAKEAKLAAKEERRKRAVKGERRR